MSTNKQDKPHWQHARILRAISEGAKFWYHSAGPFSHSVLEVNGVQKAVHA